MIRQPPWKHENQCLNDDMMPGAFSHNQNAFHRGPEPNSVIRSSFVMSVIRSVGVSFQRESTGTGEAVVGRSFSGIEYHGAQHEILVLKIGRAHV